MLRRYLSICGVSVTAVTASGDASQAPEWVEAENGSRRSPPLAYVTRVGIRVRRLERPDSPISLRRTGQQYPERSGR
jgi:hypothetical protein